MNPRAPEGERSCIGTARSRVPPLVINGTTAQSLKTFIPGRRSRLQPFPHWFEAALQRFIPVLPAVFRGGHKTSDLKLSQVFCHRLPGDGKPLGELGRGGRAPAIEPFEDLTSGRIADGREGRGLCGAHTVATAR